MMMMDDVNCLCRCANARVSWKTPVRLPHDVIQSAWLNLLGLFWPVWSIVESTGGDQPMLLVFRCHSYQFVAARAIAVSSHNNIMP
jgi:hypothetical protein